MRRYFLILPVLACLLFVACKTAKPPDEVLETKTFNQIMKSGKDVEDPVHGKQVKFYYGAVSGSDGTQANGIAYIHLYENGTSTVTVNLNIALPENGHYVAYILDSSGKQEIEIGALQSIFGDVRHSVKNETTEDITKTLLVQVRRESRGTSTVVAEGTLKEPALAK